ncbi:MAG: class I SAM-dependent methyltransferase [Betaproteobacteria bacterium]|nr:class I SAM-dependent methyltransferase [Betaproteobacteria bacterium]
MADYAAIQSTFDGSEGAFLAHLDVIEDYSEALEKLGGEPPPAPRWTQDWFPRLDAAAAYSMVRRWRPRRIVEIGSGHSTRFLARAVADAGLDTRITAIDPAPRASLAGLEIELLRVPVQQAGDTPFTGLVAGDLLVVDSSHVLMPGTDVDFILNRVLPRVPAGVLVHFHDVFLPSQYPVDWHWRGYNEQQAVATLIVCGAYVAEFSSAFIGSRCADRLCKGVLGRLPFVAGAHESSLWLRKTE